MLEVDGGPECRRVAESMKKGIRKRTAKESRERMVESAAALIGSRGVAATAFSDVLAESGAPRGSLYYYFPAGKKQLIEDAVRFTSAQIVAYQRECRATTPAGVLSHFVRLFRRSVTSSKCRMGCPVAAVVVDAYARGEPLGDVVRQTLASWVDLLASQLRSAGLPTRHARSLALTALASVEGALILCRAQGNLRPMDAVDDQLRVLALRDGGRGRGP
jgi:AcrR family transcriptional regulator